MSIIDSAILEILGKYGSFGQTAESCFLVRIFIIIDGNFNYDLIGNHCHVEPLSTIFLFSQLSLACLLFFLFSQLSLVDSDKSFVYHSLLLYWWDAIFSLPGDCGTIRWFLGFSTFRARFFALLWEMRVVEHVYAFSDINSREEREKEREWRTNGECLLTGELENLDTNCRKKEEIFLARATSKMCANVLGRNKGCTIGEIRHMSLRSFYQDMVYVCHKSLHKQHAQVTWQSVVYLEYSDDDESSVRFVKSIVSAIIYSQQIPKLPKKSSIFLAAMALRSANFRCFCSRYLCCVSATGGT